MSMLKGIEHGVKNFVFVLLQVILSKGQEDFKPLDGNKLKKILFLRPEKIGDMVISFPVFDALKKHFPYIKLSILGSPMNAAIIKNDPRFDKIFLYKKNIWKDFRQLLTIRKEKYDCVVDMICDDSVTALFLSQFTAPGKPRIGVGKMKFREYYDYNYDHRMGNTGHIIENTLKLLEAFNLDPNKVNGYAPPYINNDEISKAEQFLEFINNGNKATKKIGYNLSAGSPTRIWAEQKTVDLIKWILQNNGDRQIILITIPKERQKGEIIKNKFTQRVDLVPDNMTLTEAAALISKLDVLISPDTSLVHIARSFQVPVVGLYSRFMKNFLLWKPYGQKSGAVVSSNDDNIHDITVEQVLTAFEIVMAEEVTMEGK